MRSFSFTRFALLAAALIVALLTVSAIWGAETAVGVFAVASLVAQGAFNPTVLGVNALGTLAPNVVSLTVLDNLRKMFPTLNLVTTDFSKDPVKWNKKTTTRVVTVPTVSDYDEANGYVPGDATTTDIDITLNKWKHVSFEFSAAELNGTNRALAQEQMASAAYALGKQMFADLYALVTPGNFTNASVVATTANTNRSVINKIRKTLSNRGVAFPRFGVLIPDAFESVTNDDKVISNLYVPDDGTALPVSYVEGVINKLAGFEKIFEFPDLPTTNNLSGFFGAKSSLCIIARVPEDAALVEMMGVPVPGKVEIFTDPTTGLSIMARYNYDMQKAKLFMTLVLMYGVAVGVQDQGQLLTIA